MIGQMRDGLANAAVQELRRVTALRAGSEPVSPLALAALERRLDGGPAREFARLTAAEEEEDHSTRLEREPIKTP